jgi:hypothetical protein
MYTEEMLEEIVESEFKGLCMSCSNVNDCHYRRASIKLIIQCELYEMEENKQQHLQPVPKGLCQTCDNVNVCKLPGKPLGVWHCNEYA